MKRPRYALARRSADRERQRTELRETIRKPPGNTVVLFKDETALREVPPLRACRAKWVERAVVPITGKNATRTVFMVLNPRTGSRLFMVRRRGRSDDFCAFLAELRAHWKRRDIVLVTGQASSHTAKKSKR